MSGRVQYEEGATKGAVLDDGILQAVADKLGVDIKVVHQLADTNGTEANGSFAAGLSQIVLGENSSNSYQTLVHEFWHMTRCAEHAPAGAITLEAFIAQRKVPGIAP